MNELHLHIVSFDIPYPPNYGGVIDVYYKIRELSHRGVKIHLHCFEYSRVPSAELESLCHRVNYYPRRLGLKPNFSHLPYIVNSRRSTELIENLLMDDYPILFEGLHTCYYLPDRRLSGRLLIYRESNLEHQYYRHLASATSRTGEKLFFLLESIRLRLFQSRLKHAGLMLTVSATDTAYLQQHFPSVRVVCLPSFHREETVDILPGTGTYALYQGKLSVPENEKAVIYLIEKVWQEDMPELIVAGMDPSDQLKRLAGNRRNVTVAANPTKAQMMTLIRNAQVHVMVTFQPTGLKLKMLNALYNGRFCLVNSAMLAGTSLHRYCYVADEPHEMRKLVKSLFEKEFTQEMIEARITGLESSEYSNEKNCKTLVDLLTLSV